MIFMRCFLKNSITRRTGSHRGRFLAHANPLLADWATKHVGSGWITDLSKMSGLEKLADNADVRREFMEIKRANKVRLAKYIKEHNGIDVNPDSIFDVQVKRLP